MCSPFPRLTMQKTQVSTSGDLMYLMTPDKAARAQVATTDAYLYTGCSKLVVQRQTRMDMEDTKNLASLRRWHEHVSLQQSRPNAQWLCVRVCEYEITVRCYHGWALRGRRQAHPASLPVPHGAPGCLVAMETQCLSLPACDREIINSVWRLCGKSTSTFIYYHTNTW